MARWGRSSYAVGYKKPPRATQFKPGQSGNAKGRPKGSKNLATDIQKELDARISVTENGKRKSITKRQAVAKQLVNKAAAGDPKSTPIVLKVDGADEGEAGFTASDVFGGAEDALVMESIVRRIRQMDAPLLMPEVGTNEPGRAEAPSSIQPPTIKNPL